MTGQLYYPKADRRIQRFDDDYAGVRWEGPAEKGCLHTTETIGWPGYGGGATAPNFTVRPNFTLRRLEWRQHFPANMSARALQNDRGGVETNRDKVIQVEIVGTCDGRPKSPSLPKGGAHVQWKIKGIPHLYTANPPEWFFEQMADFFVWCNEEHGIPFEAPKLWLPYDASYGDSDARMSGAEFNSFRGWLGHMHVAENDHGDPGALDVHKIIHLATRPPTPQEELDMKATDQIRISSPSAREILNQPDGVMTYEEILALQTAAALAGNKLMAEIRDGQDRIEEKLNQLLSKPE